MAKILIPTPLRPYTDKQDAVDAAGATVGELLADLTAKHAGLKAHLYNEQGKLRSFVNVYVNDEDIRYLQKEQTPVAAGDTVSIIPSVAGGAPATDGAGGTNRPGPRAADADQRRGEALLAPPDHAGGRRRRSAQAEGGEGAVHRRRRAGIAGGDVSRGRRRRHHRPRRFRRRRLQQPAAADPAQHPDVGRPKLASAKDKLTALNPEIEIRTHEVALSSENAMELFAPYDVIVDGTDNFPTRYLVNDACVLLGKAERLRQHLPVRRPGVGVRDQGRPVLPLPVSRAASAGLVPSCAEGGVLGVLPGMIGMVQATETIKLIIGIGEPLDRPLPHL